MKVEFLTELYLERTYKDKNVADPFAICTGMGSSEDASIEEAFKHLKEHYTDFAPNQIAKIETYQIPQHYTEQELA
jgi:hypothetical protein